MRYLQLSLRGLCRVRQRLPYGGRYGLKGVRISWPDTSESAKSCRYTPSWDRLRNHRGVVAQFTEKYRGLISLRIPLISPYLKQPEPVLNDFGLPEKDYYTTGGVCKVLKIKPDTFTYRLERRYYPKPIKVGRKRRFTEAETREILKTTKDLIRK